MAMDHWTSLLAGETSSFKALGFKKWSPYFQQSNANFHLPRAILRSRTEQDTAKYVDNGENPPPSAEFTIIKRSEQELSENNHALEEWRTRYCEEEALDSDLISRSVRTANIERISACALEQGFGTKEILETQSIKNLLRILLKLASDDVKHDLNWNRDYSASFQHEGSSHQMVRPAKHPPQSVRKPTKLPAPRSCKIKCCICGIVFDQDKKSKLFNQHWNARHQDRDLKCALCPASKKKIWELESLGNHTKAKHP
ncbi:hypothetical protein C8R44DRAFT_739314 [Mycena epipterygia]|nr:hypothetical protein C8R44DRAFT_739314 [Mycena epipterygia]